MAASFAKICPLILFILIGMSFCQQPKILSPSQAPSNPNGLDTYNVITVKPPANEDKTHFALRILSKAIGDDKSATFALLYTYSHATTGFAARLTLDQVFALESTFSISLKLF